MRSEILKHLTENKRKNPRDDCPYQRALDAMDVAGHVSSDAPAAKQQAEPASGTSTGSSSVPFINQLTTDEVKAIHTTCERWIYRWALPLRTTESPDCINFSKALNAVYTPPSRYSMAETLLPEEFNNQQRMVDCFVRRCVDDGDVEIGGDLWGDRLNNSMCNVIIFTPDSLYVENKVSGEARHSAENTAEFFSHRIGLLGARSVVAIVTDTENKMQAMCALLQKIYPWMLAIPCAAHCLDLLFGDMCKHPYVASALDFFSSSTHYWRPTSMAKAILNRSQLAEYGKTVQLQHPGDTRWQSQLIGTKALLTTQCAVKKAAVDAVFKSECPAGGTAKHRAAALKASTAVRHETNWDTLALFDELLQPLGVALDVGQSNGRGLEAVRRALFTFHEHFEAFSYQPTTEGTGLRQLVLRAAEKRRRYTLRPIHCLAYLLDARYVDKKEQLDTDELSAAIDLLQSMARAHDIKMGTRKYKCTADKLPKDYSRETEKEIMAEYTTFKSKAGSFLHCP